MDLVKQTLFLDKETFPRLDQIALAHGVRRSLVIRWAIQEYLKVASDFSLTNNSIKSTVDLIPDTSDDQRATTDSIAA